MIKVRPFASVLLFLISLSSFGQIVPSSCETTDPVEFLYSQDAALLSILELQRQGSPYYDSIQFPDSLLEKKLRALIAVYNVTGIPQADTVAHIKPVHYYHASRINQFVVAADGNLSWMQNLKNQQLPCGHAGLDKLLIQYNISEYQYNSRPVFGKIYVTFTTPSWLNTHAIAQKLEAEPEIQSFPMFAIGDGAQIQDSVFADHIELTYSHGWGDCMVGCIYRRYWKFKVYDDCSVEFVESSGGTLPPTLHVAESSSKESWKVFPNPFNNTIEIGNLYEPCHYALYSVDGRLLKEDTVNEPRITDLDFLPKGLYILHLQTQDTRQFFRISKAN